MSDPYICLTLLGDASLRCECRSCFTRLTVPVDKIALLFQQRPPTCPTCGHAWGTTPDLFAKLAQLLAEFAKIDKHVEVGIVLH